MCQVSERDLGGVASECGQGVYGSGGPGLWRVCVAVCEMETEEEGIGGGGGPGSGDRVVRMGMCDFVTTVM